MPDAAQRTIEIILRGRDQLSKGLNKANRELDNLAETSTDLAGGLLAVEAAIIAVGTAFAAASFNAASKFESALTDVEKLLQDTSKGALKELKNEVIELSEVYGTSSIAILGSVGTFKQAGFEIEESFELTRNALDLAIAGEIEAGQAAEYLTASIKGFNIEATEAERIVNILNRVSNKYATGVDELAIGFSKLSPIAKLAGLSLEETAGVLTPAIEVFRSGDDAATALKTGLQKLIDGSAPVTGALEKLGVSATTSTGALRSSRDILFDVGEAFKTADQNQKLFLASELVGIDQAGRMVTVFDNLNKVTEITKVAAFDKTGDAALEVAKRLNTAEVAGNRLAVSFENLLKGVGTKYLEEAKGVINGTTAMNQAFREAVDEGALDDLFNAFKPQLERIENLFFEVAKNLPQALENVNFDKVLNAFGNLGEAAGGAFSAMFGDLDGEPVENLSEIIQRVVDSIAVLTEVTAGFVEGLEPVFRTIGVGVEELNKSDQATQNIAGNIAGAMATISSAGALIGGAILIIGQNADAIQTTFNVIIGGAKIVFNVIQVMADTIIGAVTGIVAGLANLADFLTLGVFKGLSDFAETSTLAVAATAQEMRGNFIEIGEGWDKLTGQAVESGEKTAQSLEKVAEKQELLKGETVSTFSGLTDFLKANAAASQEVADQVDKTAFFTEKLDKLQKDLLQDTVKSTKDLTAAKKDLVKTDKETAKASKEATDALKAQQRATEKLRDQAIKLYEAELAARTALAEIESVERTAIFEATVDFNVEKIKADSAEAVAAIGVLGTVIESTGLTITSLFDNFVEVGDGDSEARRLILDQIRLENDIRIKAFRITKKLNEAQIEKLEAEAKRLNRDDAILTVQADGLQPHLEAIWREILAAIQIEAAQEGAELLLAV